MCDVLVPMRATGRANFEQTQEASKRASGRRRGGELRFNGGKNRARVRFDSLSFSDLVSPSSHKCQWLCHTCLFHGEHKYTSECSLKEAKAHQVAPVCLCLAFLCDLLRLASSLWQGFSLSLSLSLSLWLAALLARTKVNTDSSSRRRPKLSLPPCPLLCPCRSLLSLLSCLS